MWLKRSFTMISLLALAACSAGADDEAVEEPATDAANMTEATTEGATFTTTARLNLRETPSRTAKIVTTMANGATVTAIEAEPTEGFYHVDFNGKQGWAHGQYLKATTPAAEAAPESPEEAKPNVPADNGSAGDFDGRAFSNVTLLWQGNWDFLIKCDSYSRKRGNVTFYCGDAESRSFVDDEAWLAMPSGSMSKKMCNTRARVCKGDACVVAKIVERSVTAGSWEGSTAVLSALGVKTGFTSCTSSQGTAKGVTITLE